MQLSITTIKSLSMVHLCTNDQMNKLIKMLTYKTSLASISIHELNTELVGQSLDPPFSLFTRLLAEGVSTHQTTLKPNVFDYCKSSINCTRGREGCGAHNKGLLMRETVQCLFLLNNSSPQKSISCKCYLKIIVSCSELFWPGQRRKEKL